MSILSAETLATIQEWPGHKLNVLLAVDVGGTHMRIALALPNRTSSFTLDKHHCSSHSHLLEILQQLSKELCGSVPAARAISKKVNVVAACLAAAGPITDGGSRVVITNYEDAKTFGNGAGVSVDDIPDEIFPSRQSCFVNDLEGLCHGVISLADHGQLFNVFRPMWGKLERGSTEVNSRGTHRAEKSPSEEDDDEHPSKLDPVNYLVLAVGTGLGCSTLLRRVTPDGTLEHRPLALEFGHSQISALGSDHPHAGEDERFRKYLSAQLWKGRHAPEWEDVCSGRGLVNCYNFALSERPGETHAEVAQTAVAVATAAREGNAAALYSVGLHYSYLMRFAQQLSVGFQAKGVFLAGDNQVSNQWYFWNAAGEGESKHLAELKGLFEDHQKAGWLQPAAVWGQAASVNLIAMGCLHVATRLREC